MTVYVDLLFGINAVINYLLLRGSAALSACPVRGWRLAAAACLGGAYAVLAVVPGMEPLNGVYFQLLCAGVMLLAAFGWKRNTVKQGLFFFALSFVFSGAVMIAVQLVEPDFVLLGGRAYYAVSAPALLLLAGLCYGVAAVVLSGWGQHTGGDIVPLELSLGENTVQLRALRDTGNTLRDPLTGQPVLVTGWQTLTRLLPQARLEQGQFRDPAGLIGVLSARCPSCRFRLVPYRAVGTRAGLLPAVRCRCTAEGKTTQTLVAFSAETVDPDGRYEALLGGAIT